MYEHSYGDGLTDYIGASPSEIVRNDEEKELDIKAKLERGRSGEGLGSRLRADETNLRSANEIFGEIGSVMLGRRLESEYSEIQLKK